MRFVSPIYVRFKSFVSYTKDYNTLVVDSFYVNQHQPTSYVNCRILLFLLLTLNAFSTLTHFYHCMKSVRIRSCSDPSFPALRLNMERYFVSLRIQSKCGKIRTTITPNTDTFYTKYIP